MAKMLILKMVKLALLLVRVILLVSLRAIAPNKHTYYVIDGLVRYEYVSKPELPAKEERTEDERFET